MLKRKQSVIMTTTLLLLSGIPNLSHAADSQVMGVEGTVPAPPYMPTNPPAYVSQIPPDYSPPPQQAQPPAPIYVAPQPAQVVLPATPPQFVYVPELGYYVAMGLPYDMIYDGRAYYFHNNGYWYQTPYYGGPWMHVERRLLPPTLVRFNVREVHRYRDVEFRRYERERGHYRGRLHRPEVRGRERREEHHEERGGR